MGVKILRIVLLFLVSNYDKQIFTNLLIDLSDASMVGYKYSTPMLLLPVLLVVDRLKINPLSAHINLTSLAKWLWSNSQCIATYGNLQKAMIEQGFTKLEIPTLDAHLNC